MQNRNKMYFILALGIILAVNSSATKVNVGTSKPNTKVIDMKPLVISTINYETPKIEQCEINIKSVKQIEPYYISEIPLSKDLQKYIYDLCNENNVDYELALSVIWKESKFESNLINKNSNQTHDYGLFQINTVNLQWIKDTYNITDIMNEKSNIKGGIGLIAESINKHGGERNGILAYHLGDNGYLKLRRKGYKNTSYSKDVLRKKSEYTKLIKTM
jgi:hypothetical protein